MRRFRVPGMILAVSCTALALSACGAQKPSASTPPQTQPPSSRSAEPAQASAMTPAPRQRAEADAAALLRSFVVPPGGRRLARPPKLPGGWLTFPQSRLVSTSMVDEATFWEAPGGPQAVLAWEQARLLPRFTLGDADFGPPSWDRSFALAPVGVLTDRELVVEVVSVGGGQTGIRVDAQVGWQQPRPAGEAVPSAARVVTITELPGVLPRAGRPPSPVTITDPAVAGRLAALIDGLPLSSIPADASCPAPLGGGLQLTFRARAGGQALAVARTDQACGTVSLSVGGKQEPALSDDPGPDSRILRLAGLAWKLNY